MASVKKRIRNFKYNSCIRKKPYPNYLKVLIRLIKRKIIGHEGLHIYKCLFCNHYHLGRLRKDTLYRKRRIQRLMEGEELREEIKS